MKTYHFLFLVIVIVCLNSSCKKENNFTKKHVGEYYFKTEATVYMGGYYGDTTIYFSGSITSESESVLKIVYGPSTEGKWDTIPKSPVFGTITPSVDEIGILSYQQDPYNNPGSYFGGKFDDNGNVEIDIGLIGLGHGWSNKIHGAKKK